MQDPALRGGPPGTCRKIFLGFTTCSRSQRDRLEGAKELKRLVFYSNIVVAPLLEDCNVSTGSCALYVHKVPATSLSLSLKADAEFRQGGCPHCLGMQPFHPCFGVFLPAIELTAQHT